MPTTTPNPTPYPLLFNPILFPKVWGGQALRQLGKEIPPNATIGESWELADMPSTSASGAGGNPVRSVIRQGDLAGRTLAEAMNIWGTALLGSAKPTPEGNYPLLVKFLDANENLSVQVHPSPAYAFAHPECKLKHECWYILAAQPGAVIYKGLKPGTTRQALRKATIAGTIAEMMVAVPAVAGECHNLPSGTCHALGKGVLVAEVQTPSDTTFRLYDWGRTGRELHTQHALTCIDLAPAPAPTRKCTASCAERHVCNEAFTLDEFTPGAGESLGVGPAGQSAVVIMLAGQGRLQGPFEPITVHMGQTCLIPASIAEGTTLTSTAGPCTYLRAALRS